MQFKARATVDEGLAQLAPLVHRARAAHLIVLPEMALHGYAFTTREQVLAVAEPAAGGTCSAIAELARSARSWLVAGFPERDGDRLHNSARVFDPAGCLVGVARKNLLYEADEPWATAGSERHLFQTDAGSFAVGICMDLNDDDWLAWCARAAPTAIAFPANWIQDEGAVWDYWRFRLHRGWPAGWVDLPNADPHRAPVTSTLVAANSYGTEGVHLVSGQSAILARHRLFATATSRGDQVLLADLSETSA